MSRELYIYIRAWCRFMNSASYYVDYMMERARREHAPSDAIEYDEHVHSWATLSGLQSRSLRATIERIAKEMESGR